MLGAAAGFLWWNAAPARIFMGDTGALALGGLFGALAIVTNTQLLLVVIGGLFVIETLSVIAQVISFRGFGRRVFRMSPIHHHFELAGWPEFTGDRPVLDHRRALLGRRASGCSTRTSSRGEASDDAAAFAGERAVVIGAGVAGARGRRGRSRAEGADVLRHRRRREERARPCAPVRRNGRRRSRRAATEPEHLDGRHARRGEPRGAARPPRCSPGRARGGSRSGARWSSERGSRPRPTSR